MTFMLYNNSTQMAQFVVLLIFTPLSVLVTALRFVAWKKGNRKLGMEDGFCVLATIFAVLCNVCALMAISVLNGRNIVEEIVKTPQDYKLMRQWDMAGLYMFFGHILFVKLAILALYRRIFGVNRSYLVSIYVLAAVQIVLVIIFCIFQALQCRPFGRYFDLRIQGTCSSEGVVVLGGGLPDSLVDFAAVVLAMWMIKSLQISTKVKWRLRMLFGIGFLVGIIGFIKIAITYSTEAVFALSMVSLMSAVQMFLSLLCASVPVYRPILPSGEAWGQLMSRLTLTYTRRSSKGTAGSKTGGSADRGVTRFASNSKQTFEDDRSSGDSKAFAGWNLTGEATHVANAHAMGNLSTEHLTPATGIHVRHDVAVSESSER